GAKAERRQEPAAARGPSIRRRLSTQDTGNGGDPGMKKHRMKWIWISAGTVLGLASVVKSQPASPTARAELRNAQGEIVGRATLSTEAEAVVITLEPQKLPPGPHGFHIHEVGKVRGARVY